MFVAKFIPFGPLQFEWAKAAATDGRVDGVKACGTAIFPLVGGNFEGTNISFGTQTLTNLGTNSSDIFLVSHDFAGGVRWLRQLGGQGVDSLKDVVGASVSYYACGWFQSPSFSVGTTNLTLAGTNGADGFVIKYSTSGNVTWVSHGVNAGVNLVAYDGLNNVYAAGTVLGEVSFGGLSLSNSSTGTFAVKLNSSGSPLWIRGDMHMGSALTVDKSQNIITAGTFSNTVQFGQTVLSNDAPGTVYIAKFDNAGEPLWARQLEGLGNDQVTAITVDRGTNYWITGSFRSEDLSSEHGFIACFNLDGDLLGVTQLGGASGSVVMDVDNFLGMWNYVCGHFATNLTESGFTVTNGGIDELYIGKLQMTPPRLASATTSNNLVLSWPAISSGYSGSVLETTTDPVSPSWNTATNIPVNVGGVNMVTNGTLTNQQFFRLRLQPE
jgi:hypothetical protein